METFELDREIAHLAVLQRTELIDRKLRKIRKLFGRYLFSNFFSKYFINIKKVSKNYFEIMQTEYNSIEKFMKPNQNILCIGSGIGGLEIIINQQFLNNKFHFIERNFISKKVRYGWDTKNSEAYNDLKLLEKFLILNHLKKNNFKIINFDLDELPKNKYNLVTSLYSLDFHYDFEIYKNYLKNVSTEDTFIIFDTIRPDYFNKIFKSIEILKTENDTVHRSKRLACRGFIN